MNGIRLDSGKLAELSIQARRLLDEAGFPDAQIVASDSLDEYAIRDLKAQGAKIGIWGIGTRLATGHEQGALGGVYKLSAIKGNDGNWESKVKQSETAIKSSNPGKLGIRRYFSNDRPIGSQLFNELGGEPQASVVTTEGGQHHLSGECRQVMQPVFRDGTRVYQPPSLRSSRDLALKNWALWNSFEWDTFHYGLSPELQEEKSRLLASAS